MLSPLHVVAAVTLISDNFDRVLLVENPERGWECPGGQIEEGEDILAGLKREVFEETGIQVKVVHLAGVYSNFATNMVVFTFLSKYVSGVLTTSPESIQTEWVIRNESLKRVSHPAILARIGDMLNFNGKVIYCAYTNDPYQILSKRTF